MNGGFITRWTAQTDEVEDSGLSVSWLANESDHSVRLVSVQFASPPADLHVMNVYAYSYKDTHQGLIGQFGVLPKECPQEFKPHPLSVTTFPPHADAPWLVVIAFTISRPGIYHLNRVRLDYSTEGRTGWQYQNINTTVTVKNPPLPGCCPLPRSAVC